MRCTRQHRIINFMINDTYNNNVLPLMHQNISPEKCFTRGFHQIVINSTVFYFLIYRICIKVNETQSEIISLYWFRTTISQTQNRVLKIPIPF